MVDGNKLGDVGFQKIGTPYSTMDCQAFVEWCLRQCGCNKDLAGSNAWYREVYNHGWIGSPEECVKMLGCVPKGAFLFIQAFDGEEPMKYRGDGMGNASHIGICTIPRGEGAINSSYSRGCVCESKFKQKTINGGWNKVGLWDQVSYEYSGSGGSGGGGSSPDPEPEPAQDQEWALIGNVPAGNRQDVNFRKKPNIYAELIDRIPVGHPVEVLSNNGEWSKVKWNGQTGYVMSKFLTYYEEHSGLYTVCIQHLDKTQADAMKRNYPQAIVTEEKE